MNDAISQAKRLELYHDRLALPKNAPTATAKAALQRAHELRRFEIENYWRRSTYVWGLQLVAFAALALSAEKGRFAPPIVILVASLGIVTSLAAVLTSQGSRFWQKNWEAHVDLLEDAGEGNLHKIVLANDGIASYSVSRVNERFLEVLLLGWILAFVAAAIATYDPSWMRVENNSIIYLQIGLPLFLVIIAAFRMLRTKSKLNDRLYNRETILKVRTD